MTKIFYFYLLFFFLSNCSLDSKTGLWSKSEDLNKENETIEIKLFEEAKVYEKEFNSNLKIKLKSKFKENSFINNLSNNNGIVQFNGELKKVSKYKFSKISQFDQYQPELLFTKKIL